MNTNSEELSIEKCKELELGVLKYIKNVCDNNSLRYYLAYGTLLGAVRHKGFIPWDDDIDIFMPYEDYLEFVKIESSKKDSRYKLICIESNADYTSPLAKVIDSNTVLYQDYGLIENVELGLYVDVFVLNGVGDDYSTAHKITSKFLSMNKELLLSASVIKKELSIRNALSAIRHFPYKLIGYKHFLDKIVKFRQGKSFSISRYVTQTSLISVNTVKRNIWEKDDYGDGVNVCFEGEEFKAPSKYEKLLREFFGDYMTLPPKDKQVTHHTYRAYFK